MPDGVLFDDTVGLSLRTWLMELCDLHTILRLPTGIFYAQGVKTNVIFFNRGKTDCSQTKGVWVYDMRTNMNSFGKTRPLTIEDFAAFEVAYGKDPAGHSKRKDEGEHGRFRYFSRQNVKERNEKLDIVWLRDMSGDPEGHNDRPRRARDGNCYASAGRPRRD